MNKNLILVGAVIAFFLLAGGGYLFLRSSSVTTPPAPQATQPDVSTTTVFDGRSASFTVDGQLVTLTNGVSQVPAAPGSASMETTRYFGNEAMGDLTGDGKNDIAFLVSRDTGGSGLFYYAVVAYATPSGYKTTNAFLIGDRIAPQSTYIPKNSQELQVNFAERKPGEPMTTPPSVGATLLLKVTPDGILEGLMK